MLNTLPNEQIEQEGFEACRQAVTRYLKRHAPDDAEDLIQETCMRIWKNIQVKKIIPHEGHCILTAKNVLREHWRKTRGEDSLDDDDSKIDLLDDGGREIADREKLSACRIDCFERIDLEDKILLWRYSVKKEFRLFEDEVYDSSAQPFQFLYPLVEKIKKIFLPIQAENAPLSGEEKKRNRLKIFRLRRDLIKCLKDCLEKYSVKI